MEEEEGRVGRAVVGGEEGVDVGKSGVLGEREGYVGKGWLQLLKRRGDGMGRDGE